MRFVTRFHILILTFEGRPRFCLARSRVLAASSCHGAKLLYAYAEATVPKITVITRKAYGGFSLRDGIETYSHRYQPAWPTAEIAVMGPEGAVNTVYRRELAGARDPEAMRRQKTEEFRERFANPVRRRGARVRGRCDRAARGSASARDRRPAAVGKQGA